MRRGMRCEGVGYRSTTVRCVVLVVYYVHNMHEDARALGNAALEEIVVEEGLERSSDGHARLVRRRIPATSSTTDDGRKRCAHLDGDRHILREDSEEAEEVAERAFAQTPTCGSVEKFCAS